jgi:hypothetical protein
VALLNHLIVWCTDKQRGASHVVDVLGLGPPRDFVGEFLIVDMGNGVSLDYANWRDGDLFEIITQPYGAETEASGG